MLELVLLLVLMVVLVVEVMVMVMVMVMEMEMEMEMVVVVVVMMVSWWSWWSWWSWGHSLVPENGTAATSGGFMATGSTATYVAGQPALTIRHREPRSCQHF